MKTRFHNQNDIIKKNDEKRKNNLSFNKNTLFSTDIDMVKLAKGIIDGKIIDKEGRIIKAIRIILNSASAKLDKRTTLEIVE